MANSLYTLTGADSNTATRILYKGGLKAYARLNKVYGVYANLHKLVNQSIPENKLHGFMDDDNIYQRQPYYTSKVLIPSLYVFRNKTNLATLDPFIEEDQFMYVPANVEIYLHTLVICKLDSKRILNYRVSSIDEILNDAGLIVYRCSIVPVASINPLFNTSELKTAIEREELDRENDELNSWSTTESDFDASGVLSYKPLK